MHSAKPKFRGEFHCGLVQGAGAPSKSKTRRTTAAIRLKRLPNTLRCSRRKRSRFSSKFIMCFAPRCPKRKNVFLGECQLFGANKRHIGLYAGDAAVAAFASRLAPYKANKGTIQIPYQEPLPLELISQIAAFAAFHGS